MFNFLGLGCSFSKILLGLVEARLPLAFSKAFYAWFLEVFEGIVVSSTLAVLGYVGALVTKFKTKNNRRKKKSKFIVRLRVALNPFK